jgi:hypothetical protein
MKSLSRKRQVLAASYLNNGGFMYAFPNVHNPLTGHQESGMTLRDYFASDAMKAIIAANGLPVDEFGLINGEKITLMAYAIAEEMMKARDA